jgi:hypothetical protein
MLKRARFSLSNDFLYFQSETFNRIAPKGQISHFFVGSIIEKKRRFAYILTAAPEWRNWQTRWTQKAI